MKRRGEHAALFDTSVYAEVTWEVTVTDNLAMEYAVLYLYNIYHLLQDSNVVKYCVVKYLPQGISVTVKIFFKFYDCYVNATVPLTTSTE